MILAALLLAAAPVAIERNDRLLNFRYSWPSEAAAVPALDKRFGADAAKRRTAALAVAATDRKERLESGEAARDWNAHEFRREWSVAGQSRRLLSLSASTYTYTGGAHGMGVASTLLWDRATRRETSLDAMLRKKGWWDGAIRQPFCVLLDRERARRRGEPAKASDFFGDCPKLSELHIILVDGNRNGRFDHLTLVADQYVAGSFAEGPYEIDLPITATMASRLKPEFAASVEPQPPVQ